MTLSDKLIIPLFGPEVAPRFDLATEALIVVVSEHRKVLSEKTVVLPRSSADDLCHILMSEKVTALICGAVEEEYFQFLKWKKIEIFDAVAGPWRLALEMWQNRQLKAGDILCTRQVEGGPVS